MAKDYGDGVWRTINGRRVFIAEGQSLGDAMKKSGKFGKVSKVKGVRKNTFKDEISQGDKNRFAMGQGLSKEAVKGYAKARQDENKKSASEKYKEEMNKFAKAMGGKVTYNEKNLDEMLDRMQSREKNEESSKTKDYAKETDREQRIKNVYMMDRVLRGMNNEDALDDGWLMNGVADEDSDYGFEKFKELSSKYGDDKDYYYTDDDTYNDLVRMYKSRVKEYAKDGVFNKDYFKNTDGNWKENAGLTDEEIEFIKQDVDDFPIYNSLRGKPISSKDYGGKKSESSKIKDASYEVTSDDPNRFGDKMRKVNDFNKREEEASAKRTQERFDNERNSKLDNDILEHFGEDYGYDKGDNLKNLKGQIDYMRNPGESIHKTAERFVEGGGFLIYNDDIKEYLDDNHIKYNDDNFFDKYKQTMADRMEKLYNGESPKKESYQDYVKRTLSNDDYLRENRPNEYMNKMLRENSSKTKADRNIDAMDDKETRERIADASNKEIKQILAENQKQKINEYIDKVSEESGNKRESGVVQRAIARMTPEQRLKTYEAREKQRGQNLDEERAYYTQDRMNKIIDKQNMSDKAKASARQNLNTWKPAKNDQELRNRYSEDIAFDKGATPNASKDETRNLNNYKRVELNRIGHMLSGERVYDTRNGKDVGDARNLKEDKESTSKIMNNAIRNRKVTKAYENYIKKHPNSKITLSEFKDLYQG